MNYIDINLARLDLNLVTALSALLELQSVSDAAFAVGRTQSAMSHSLSRLRDHFQDPLLVRDGRSMTPTPFAEALRPKVTQAALAIGAVFESQTRFDPKASDRRIKIAAPDLCVPLLSPLVAKVSRDAPGMGVEFIKASSIRNAVLHSEADVGFGFGYPKTDPNLRVLRPTPLKWCTFAPAPHAYAAHAIPENWVEATHIVVGTENNSSGPGEAAAKAHGLIRHIACYAPNFSAALTLACDCDALFTTLREPFERAAEKLGLIACPPPFEMPPAPAVVTLRTAYGDEFQNWLHGICGDLF